VICARVESPKRCGEAGWLHKLRDDWRNSPPPRLDPKPERPEPKRDFAAFAELCTTQLHRDALGAFAGKMGLSVGSLVRLGLGWSLEHKAFTFPMRRGSDGKVVGIRLRLRSGRKLAVKGGREGLFVPSDTPRTGELYLPEGPTDTAALLDIGCEAVGRPSCNGGIQHILSFIARSKYAGICVVADADAPGQQWAKVLAEKLLPYAPRVWIVTPPDGHKDVRDWVRGGATKRNIDGAAVPQETRNTLLSTNALYH